MNRFASMLTPFFNGSAVNDFASASKSDRHSYSVFFHRMLEQGIYLPPAQYEATFLSAAHTVEDVDRTIDAAVHALRELAG